MIFIIQQDDLNKYRIVTNDEDKSIRVVDIKKQIMEIERQEFPKITLSQVELFINSQVLQNDTFVFKLQNKKQQEITLNLLIVGKIGINSKQQQLLQQKLQNQQTNLDKYRQTYYINNFIKNQEVLYNSHIQNANYNIQLNDEVLSDASDQLIDLGTSQYKNSRYIQQKSIDEFDRLEYQNPKTQINALISSNQLNITTNSRILNKHEPAYLQQQSYQQQSKFSKHQTMVDQVHHQQTNNNCLKYINPSLQRIGRQGKQLTQQQIFDQTYSQSNNDNQLYNTTYSNQQNLYSKQQLSNEQIEQMFEISPNNYDNEYIEMEVEVMENSQYSRSDSQCDLINKFKYDSILSKSGTQKSFQEHVENKPSSIQKELNIVEANEQAKVQVQMAYLQQSKSIMRQQKTQMPVPEEPCITESINVSVENSTEGLNKVGTIVQIIENASLHRNSSKENFSNKISTNVQNLNSTPLVKQFTEPQQQQDLAEQKELIDKIAKIEEIVDQLPENTQNIQQRFPPLIESLPSQQDLPFTAPTESLDEVPTETILPDFDVPPPMDDVPPPTDDINGQPEEKDKKKRKKKSK